MQRLLSYFSKQPSLIAIDINTTQITWIQISQFPSTVTDYYHHADNHPRTDSHPLADYHHRADSRPRRDYHPRANCHPREGGDPEILIKNFGTIEFLENDLKKLPEILRAVRQQQTLPKCYVGISLKTPFIQTAEMTFTINTSDNEIKNAARQKAIDLFNQPLKDLYLDYHLLGFSKNSSTEFVFLLTAIEKITIEQCTRYFQQSHLTLKLIDLEAYAKKRGEIWLAQPNIQIATQDLEDNLETFQACFGLIHHPALKKYARH